MQYKTYWNNTPSVKKLTRKEQTTTAHPFGLLNSPSFSVVGEMDVSLDERLISEQASSIGMVTEGDGPELEFDSAPLLTERPESPF